MSLTWAATTSIGFPEECGGAAGNTWNCTLQLALPCALLVSANLHTADFRDLQRPTIFRIIIQN